MSKNNGTSQEAIQFHYDVGNDFFKIWLDKEMIYSAGYWRTDNHHPSLEQAQLDKLDWHIRSAGVKDGDNVLDIGCGWGGLLNRALKTFSLSKASGLTLSNEQAAWIKKHHSDIEVIICPWQEFEASEKFNSIISIGAFEHFVHDDMTYEQKIQEYRNFFQFCYNNLEDGGKLSLQTIMWMNMNRENEVKNLTPTVFPESNLPYFADVVEASQKWFHVLEFHNRPDDYSKTLREWIKRLRNNKEVIYETHGKPVFRRYKKGFAKFDLGFQKEVMGLTRFSFVKRPASFET